MINDGGLNYKEEIAAIKREGIKIHPLVWDTLYLYIGDYLSAMNLVCSYYIKKNQPVSIDHSRRIFKYERSMHEILQKLLNHEKIKEESERLEQIKKENMIMPPIVKSFITHFIYNRLYIISLAVQDALDPIDTQPLSLEATKKIYDVSSNMTEVLEELRVVTQGDLGF